MTTFAETIAYRLVLIEGDSRRLLMVQNSEGYHVPNLRIPRWSRPARELQKRLWLTWRLKALVLDFVTSSGSSDTWAIVEVMHRCRCDGLRSVTMGEFQMSTDVSERQRSHVESIINGSSDIPFCRLGWIHEALAWIQSETGDRFTTKDDIEQYNAGGKFALVRFRSVEGSDIWLKATGIPNIHEFSITLLLFRICLHQLPEIIASRPAWNAWLSRGTSEQIARLPSDKDVLFSFLDKAVCSLGMLQIQTIDHVDELIHAGACDQRIDRLRRVAADLFAYVEEAMAAQTSARVAPLSALRLREIRSIFEAACCYVQNLNLPDTVLHGDLNLGNILAGPEHCRFIDWSETYIGSPTISLQHLLLLNQIEDLDVREVLNRSLMEQYRNIWSKVCDPAILDEAFVFMPLLAAASSLYGRGDWLVQPSRNDHERQSYSRTLARHMDVAAQDPALLAALELHRRRACVL